MKEEREWQLDTLHFPGGFSSLISGKASVIIPSVTKHRTPPSVPRYQLLTSLIILLRKEQHSEEVTSSRPGSFVSLP